MRARRAAVRRAWAALGRRRETRRLVQLAAACGVATFGMQEGGDGAAMRWLLQACLRVEDGKETQR